MRKACLRILLYALAAFTSACATPPQAPVCDPPKSGDRVYVVEQGWHAEFGIPVDEMDGNLQFYKSVFPGAKTVMFGYGKKTFFIAPATSLSEYILGPVPGPAAIHAVGLTVTPDQAYPPEAVIVLSLPKGGARKLSDFVWNDLAKDETGKPTVIAHSSNPDGLFYAAESRYNLSHTCNTWTADALHQAGLEISGDGVVFSGQVRDRVDEVARNQCQSQ